MRRGIKLVQKYTLGLTMLVQKQSGIAKKNKINANKNQTGAKYTLLLTMLVQKQSGIQKKTNANRNKTGAKIHTGPYNAGIEPVWYCEEKQN